MHLSFNPESTSSPSRYNAVLTADYTITETDSIKFITFLATAEPPTNGKGTMASFDGWGSTSKDDKSLQSYFNLSNCLYFPNVLILTLPLFKYA